MAPRKTSRITERIEEIHDYWIDVEKREMWIHGVDNYDTDVGVEPGVEYLMATRVIKNLHVFRHLFGKNPEENPVIIHLHTCGGDVTEGLAIYDAIKSMPYHVTMISYTHASSMSSYILQAADKRILLPHSYFMFHEGSIESIGNLSEVHSEMDFCKKYEEFLMDIYVQRAKEGEEFKNQEPSQIKRRLQGLMDRKGDVYLLAHEAVKWGFADGILNTWEEL